MMKRFPVDGTSSRNGVELERFAKKRNKLVRNVAFCIAITIFIIIGNVVKYNGKNDRNTTDDSGDELRSHTRVTTKNVHNVKHHDENCYVLKPWKRVRLPNNIRPIHYNMFLKVNLQKWIFSGKSYISVQLTEATNTIIFHVNKLSIQTIQVHGFSDDKAFKIERQFHYKRNQFYVVVLVNKLKVGEYKLKINFDGKIETKELNGFYKSSYKTKDGKTRVLALTDFEPADARKAFPCFDEPAMKATFTISIEHDSKYSALSNMNVQSRTRVSDMKTVTKFAKSVRMSTYLVAYIVCDFKSLKTTTGQYNNITIRTWGNPEQYKDSAYALSVGKNITTFYERYYGIPYPLPKQDMIAVPDFNSMGMENWGIIMYREIALFYKPDVSSALNKEKITHVVAHELAHMWFGNLVSCFWWNDLWLNEGFASYVEYLGTNHAQPDWEYLDMFVINDLYPAFRLDALASSHPISVDVQDPADIATIYDHITYCKGASIIRMLSNFLGESVFKQGIKYYLEKHKFQNANSSDLWDALSKTSGIDIGKIMDSWTNQMGFPVVHVSRASTGKGKACQKHFLLSSNAKGANELDRGYLWYIPFSYIVEGNAHEKGSFWLNKTSAMFDWPNGKWLKANINQGGYYRVNYDKENWERLTDVLENNHEILALSDRTSLIDDAFTLARSGQLDYEIAFNLASYMKKETRYVPWRAFIDNVDHINKLLGMRHFYGDFQKFILDIIESRIDMVGWKKSSKDKHLDIHLRSLILNAASTYGHKRSIENMKKMFTEYLESKHELDVDQKEIIYYHGIANTGEREWRKLFEIYQRTNIASERNKMLHGLSASRSVSVLKKFLEYSIDETKIRSQDTVIVINCIAENPTGHNIAWKFLKQHWNVFYERYSKSSFRLASLITSTTSLINTKTGLKEVKDFFKGRDTGSGTRAVDLSIERVEENINWLEKSAPSVEQFLASIRRVKLIAEHRTHVDCT